MKTKDEVIAEIWKLFGKCTCGPEYTERELTSPHCENCNFPSVEVGKILDTNWPEPQPEGDYLTTEKDSFTRAEMIDYHNRGLEMGKEIGKAQQKQDGFRESVRELSTQPQPEGNPIQKLIDSQQELDPLSKEILYSGDPALYDIEPQPEGDKPVITRATTPEANAIWEGVKRVANKPTQPQPEPPKGLTEVIAEIEKERFSIHTGTEFTPVVPLATAIEILTNARLFSEGEMRDAFKKALSEGFVGNRYFDESRFQSFLKPLTEPKGKE